MRAISWNQLFSIGFLINIRRKSVSLNQMRNYRFVGFGSYNIELMRKFWENNATEKVNSHLGISISNVILFIASFQLYYE